MIPETERKFRLQELDQLTERKREYVYDEIYKMAYFSSQNLHIEETPSPTRLQILTTAKMKNGLIDENKGTAPPS